MKATSIGNRAWLAAVAVLAGVLVVAIPARAVVCNHNGIREGAEQCDGNDKGPYRCTDLCKDGGTLKCKTDCTLDTSCCCTCGNGRLESNATAGTYGCPSFDCNETCDGADLGGATCLSRGFPEGPATGGLACQPACNDFNTDGCYWCGNGRMEGPEDCDGSNFGPLGSACTSRDGWPTHGGTLNCTAGGTGRQFGDSPNPGCHLDKIPCWVCGNGRGDPGEDCDHGASNGQPGDTCDATCHVTGCGDGVIEGSEACDDGNTTANDGCTSCGQNHPYFGSANSEAYDECEQRWALEATVTGSSQTGVTENTTGISITCTHNGATGTNPCDAVNGDNNCTFLTFYCMNLVSLNPSGCGPTQVKEIDLLSGTTVDTVPVLAAFKQTLEQLGGGTTTQTASSIVVTTPSTGVATRSICGQFNVVVPVGATPQVLKVQTKDNGTRVDADQITYTCQ